MNITKANLESVIKAHIQFRDSILNDNGNGVYYLDVMDIGLCSLGTLLNRINLFNERIQDLKNSHYIFHYWCSIALALKSINVNVDEAVKNKIMEVSLVLIEKLNNYPCEE